MSSEQWTEFAPQPKQLEAPDEWNVFLSYRSVNRPWVLTLYDVLRQHGYKVFLDQCVLKPGDQLTVNLEKALENSQTGILVWSNYTRDSTWVLDEYAVMHNQSKNKPGFILVPVTLDDSKLPAFAATRVYVNFTSYPDGPNGGELLRLFYALVGQPLTEEAAHFANEQDVASKASANKIDGAVKNGDWEYLIELFEKGGLVWETSSALGCKAAQGLIDLGRRDEAFVMLGKLQEQFPVAIRPKQLYALALAKKGETKAAQRILGELYAQGERDPETLGIYGRTWMDRYEKSGDTNDLRQSRDLYAEAFEGAKVDYYTGINAAAKSVFIGEEEDILEAAEYAQRVHYIVGTTPTPDDYWQTATVAEAFLIQKKYEEAGHIYQEAVIDAHTKIDSHLSTWTQACRLMEKLHPTDEQRALIRKAFQHLPDCEEI